MIVNAPFFRLLGYVLYVASNLISDGSDLLLLLPKIAGVVGPCILPVLRSIPVGMIVLCSGMGLDAQERLDVGIGSLAGSTITLLTLPWALSIYKGRVSIEDGIPQYTRTGRKMENTVLGVANSASVKCGGICVAVTSVSYLVLQVAAASFMGNKAEQPYAILGFFISVALFIGFMMSSQHRHSTEEQDYIVEVKRANVMINQIEKRYLSLTDALYYELRQYEYSSMKRDGYEAVSSANEFWTRLPTSVQGRVSTILKYFFRKVDTDAGARPQQRGALDFETISALFKTMSEPYKSRAEIADLFRKYDGNNDGILSVEEFIQGTVQYILNHNREVVHTELAMTSFSEAYNKNVKLDQSMHAVRIPSPSNNDDAQPSSSSSSSSSVYYLDDDDEIEDDDAMPENPPKFQVREQRNRVISRSVKATGFGLLLVIVFSNPMTGILHDLGRRFGINAFYVSFVLSPVAANASELAASFRVKKSSSSISMRLQSLQNAACMNNTFGLAILMGLVHFRRLAWHYGHGFALSVMAGQWMVAYFSAREYQTMATAVLVLAAYPGCLALVATLRV